MIQTSESGGNKGEQRRRRAAASSGCDQEAGEKNWNGDVLGEQESEKRARVSEGKNENGKDKDDSRELGYVWTLLQALKTLFSYHVTNFFAPSSRFGTPDDLKSLIDRAHELGLFVLMDIVHRTLQLWLMIT